ncbi:MAG: hypothetical protein R3B57_12465 [Phycisphaerales bacterium]
MNTAKPALSRRWLALPAAVAILIALGLAAAPSEPDRFEYGELTIVGENALFVTETKAVRLEPPDVKGTSRASDNGRGRVRLDVKLKHLNTLGNAGWVFVSAQSVEEGETYLMRRRR